MFAGIPFRQEENEVPAVRLESIVKAPVGGARRAYGWPGIARCIVTELSHLLPPPQNPWPAWHHGGRHRYRKDGSLEINIDEGNWRDHRTGEGGGIYSLLAKLLGSRRAARAWMADEDPAVQTRSRGAWRRPEHLPQRPQARPQPEPPPAPEPSPQGELWPEESLAEVTRRGRERVAKNDAEAERQWEAEMAKLDPAERNRRDSDRGHKGRRRSATVRELQRLPKRLQ